MDSDQQTRIVQQQAPELAARVIRNITAIQADHLYAEGPSVSVSWGRSLRQRERRHPIRGW